MRERERKRGKEGGKKREREGEGGRFKYHILDISREKYFHQNYVTFYHIPNYVARRIYPPICAFNLIYNFTRIYIIVMLSSSFSRAKVLSENASMEIRATMAAAVC